MPKISFFYLNHFVIFDFKIDYDTKIVYSSGNTKKNSELINRQCFVFNGCVLC